MADPVTGVAPDHPLAPDYLPFFISPPGVVDGLFIGLIIFTILLILALGVFYMHLHSVPDRMAHHANNTQLQLIGILTLLALFTHNHIYWVAALVLAALNPPDFITPLTSIARSLRRMSGRDEEEEDADAAKAKEDTHHA